MEYYVYRCLGCGHEDIGDKDGLRCSECGGLIAPIRKANKEDIEIMKERVTTVKLDNKVRSQGIGDITVKLNVDTTELDIALEKAERLVELLERAKGLQDQ